MNTPGAGLSPFGIKTLGFTGADLTPEACELLERRGVRRTYARGEAVQQRSVPPAQASWLRDGRLVCLGLQPDGTEQHGGWIMPNEIFGVNSILLSAPSRFTIQVDTEQAHILHFSHDTLLEVMRKIPQAGIGVCIGLSRRMQQQYDMLDVIGTRLLSDKLRSVLVWWAKHHGIAARDGSVELWVSQIDLANGVGASRQRVHLELQSLRDSGEIDLAYRKVIIRPLFFERNLKSSG